MKKTLTKLLSACLAVSMIATVLVLPQVVSAEDTEYVEQVIYFEDFDNVSSEQAAAWRASLPSSSDEWTWGSWYLYSGDVYTHNLAIGKNGFTTAACKMPIPFGQILDIENKRYEVTFKWNHIQYEDNIWICYMNSNDDAWGFADNNPQNRGTALRDVKIIFENSNWTVYLKNSGAAEWENIGGRAGKVVKQIDGIMLYVYGNNENSHWVDDLCVKELNSDGTTTTLYEENFDDWTMEGDGKSIKNNIKSTDCYKRFRTNCDAYLLPVSSGSDDGCIGYVKKKSHTEDKDNYMRFVFPHAMTEGKYKITFDWSTAQKDHDYIYLHDAQGNFVEYKPSFSATGFRKMEFLIDMDARTWQVNGGNITAFPEGQFTDGVTRISFRQHLNSDTSTSTMVDNFKIVKLLEEQDIEILDAAFTLKDKSGTTQYDKNNVSIKLGSIAVDFGADVDESTLTGTNITLSDGVQNLEYDKEYANGVLTILPTAKKLEHDTTYTVTLDGIKTVGGQNFIRKEFDFTTVANTPVIIDSETLVNEDFETWDNARCNSQYTDDMKIIGGFRTWTSDGIVSGKGGGNALTPFYISNGATLRSLEYYFVPELTDDTFTIDFDYKPGELSEYTDNTFSIFRSKDGAGVTVVPFSQMKNLGNVWGHIKLTVKPAEAKWTVKVTDDSGATVYENNEGEWQDASIKMISWKCGVSNKSTLSDDNKLAKIDNFVVTPMYSSGAVVTADSISFYDGDEIQNPNFVSPTLNKINVDFGQLMKADDMNANNIYITKYDNPLDIVTTSDRYENGVYTMSPEDVLVAGEKYTVHIKRVRNKDGFSTSQNYEFDFTVGKGDANIILKKLTQSGFEIRRYSDIEPGDAKLGFKYQNTTGGEYKLHIIAAYYDGTTLKCANYTTYDISEDVTDEDYEVTVTIPSGIDATSVSFMVWDGFNSMLPLSLPIEFK